MQTTIEGNIKRLIQRSPTFAQLANVLYGSYQQTKLALSNRNNLDPILVYQMGKVGSSSLVASLHAAKLAQPVYHLHSLQDSFVAGDGREARIGRAIALEHYWVSKYLKKQLDQGLGEVRWKIVTLTREPVGRNISAFFQNIQWTFPDFDAKYADGTITQEQLIKHFMEYYPHQLPLEWFNKELADVVGIDVYQEPFPRERGYQVLKGERADVLILRLETLNTYANEALSVFLNLPEFRLVNANVAEDKSYHPVYQAFKEKLRLPGAYLEKMYSSKYAQHFYSPDELAKFKSRWQK